MDNKKNPQGVAGISLSQAELDKLLAKKTAAAPAPKKEDSRNAKLAARRAQAAELAAQISAQQKHYVTVIYGSATLSQEALSALKRGDSIRLDRKADASADILVDGKLFAKGSLESDGKTVSVKLTKRKSEH